MKKLIAVIILVVMTFLVVGCTLKNVANPSDEDTSTLPLARGVRYMYSVDEGKFSAYVSGEAVSKSKIGEKIDDVSVTVGVRNNDEKFWVTKEARRAEVYTIDGIAEDVAVALKFIDEGKGTTTTHYYVMMNPDADLSAVEGYMVSPRVGNFLSGGTNIYPTVMVDGQLYEWKRILLGELPDDSVYYGEVTCVYGEIPTKDCEFMSVFSASGKIYTIPDNRDCVYLCLTTNWLDEKVVVFNLVKNGTLTD